MEDFLIDIGINTLNGRTVSNKFIIDFDNVNEFNRAFGKLDKCEDLEEQEDSSIVNASVSNIVYINDNYLINLTANFDTDEYRLVMQMLEGN